MKKKDVKSKFQFSKLIIIVQFILCVYVLYKAVNFEFNTESYQDTAIMCAIITAIFGVYGTSLIQYFKKSSSENIPKIQTSFYKETMQIRLSYNKKMMELMHKYKMTQEDIYNIENQSQIDEISDNVLNQAVSELDTRASEAHSDVENIHTY